MRDSGDRGPQGANDAGPVGRPIFVASIVSRRGCADGEPIATFEGEPVAIVRAGLWFEADNYRPAEMAGWGWREVIEPGEPEGGVLAAEAWVEGVGRKAMNSNLRVVTSWHKPPVLGPWLSKGLYNTQQGTQWHFLGPFDPMWGAVVERGLLGVALCAVAVGSGKPAPQGVWRRLWPTLGVMSVRSGRKAWRRDTRMRMMLEWREAGPSPVTPS